MSTSPDPQRKSDQNARKVLVHACCAPCTGSILEQLINEGFKPAVFFDNPNIFPEEEYSKRLNEMRRFAEEMNVPFFESSYDQQLWMQKVKGLEQEPERGKRCTVCFDMRMERTAAFAAENEFPVFTSSLGLSRWKNFDMVCACGKLAAGNYPPLKYWDRNWRKKGGSQRAAEISKKHDFYRQNYCGCVFSLPPDAQP